MEIRFEQYLSLATECRRAFRSRWGTKLFQFFFSSQGRNHKHFSQTAHVIKSQAYSWQMQMDKLVVVFCKVRKAAFLLSILLHSSQKGYVLPIKAHTCKIFLVTVNQLVDKMPPWTFNWFYLWRIAEPSTISTQGTWKLIHFYQCVLALQIATLYRSDSSTTWLIHFNFFSTSSNGSAQHDTRMLSALLPPPPPAKLFSLTHSILPNTIDLTYWCEGGCREASGLQHLEHRVALQPRPGHVKHHHI